MEIGQKSINLDFCPNRSEIGLLIVLSGDSGIGWNLSGNFVKMTSLVRNTIKFVGDRIKKLFSASRIRNGTTEVIEAWAARSHETWVTPATAPASGKKCVAPSGSGSGFKP